MKAKFIEGSEAYDGSQLVSLRSYLKHELLGDSIVAWIGPCNVALEHMVDGEDILEKAAIRGDRMVHFIVEKFDSTLLAAVALQRLLASIVRDVIGQPAMIRDGDDLFLAGKKLSISIATQSPVSSLIHFAVNVTNSGTPVPTLSLEDLKIEPREFANEVMKRFVSEVASIREATQKVRWVR